MIKPIIHSIFPIPVYTIKIDREFTKQELQFVNDQKKHCLKNDKILFSHPISYKQIKPKIDKYNIWNSETWFFPVETGNLFMFPSSTTHQVETKQGNNTRISLAFNTFIKGTLGDNSGLTELIL